MPRIDDVEIKKQVNFAATAAAGVSNNSIFMDVADDAIKTKDNAGVVMSLGAPVEVKFTDTVAVLSTNAPIVKTLTITGGTFKSWFLAFVAVRATSAKQSTSTEGWATVTLYKNTVLCPCGAAETYNSADGTSCYVYGYNARQLMAYENNATTLLSDVTLEVKFTGAGTGRAEYYCCYAIGI